MKDTCKVRKRIQGQLEQWEIDEIVADLETYHRNLTEAAAEWMVAFEKRQEADDNERAAKGDFVALLKQHRNFERKYQR